MKASAESSSEIPPRRTDDRRAMRFMMQASWTLGMAAVALLSSAVQASAQEVVRPGAAQGRFVTRPAASRPRADIAEPTGLRALRVDTGRAALLYLPAGYRVDRPTPLLV